MPIRRSPLLPIFLIVVVDVLGLTIIMPLLPFYAEHFGASAAKVGMLVSTYALCQLIAGPILGQLSDRFGRKPLLMVSQMGTFVGFLILAFAHSLGWIFFSRALDGLTAGNLSLAQAYIADVTEPKNRARAFGLIGVAFGLGFLIGPAISGYLAHYSYRYPIYVAAGLSATSILATTLLLPWKTLLPYAQQGERAPVRILSWKIFARYFRVEVLGQLLVEFFFFTFAFQTFMSGFALFAERRLLWHGHPFGVRQVGYVLAISGAFGILLQGMGMGRLVKWLGERRLVTTGMLAAAAGYAVLAFTYSPWMLLPVIFLTGYGNGVLRPALTSLITQHVAREEQGAILGLNQSLVSIAQITAPLLAGALINKLLLAPWGLVAAAVSAAGFFLSVRMKTEPMQNGAPQ